VKPPLVEEGILVIEHERGQLMPDEVGELILDRARTYGSTAVSVYQRRSSHSER
jgi:16S rRNA G966 N2-methylase RsmD